MKTNNSNRTPTWSEIENAHSKRCLGMAEKNKIEDIREVTAERDTEAKRAREAEKENQSIKEKLAILRKENRGTMHGRHEIVLDRMSKIINEQPFSSRPTELVFFEWVESLVSENQSLKAEVEALSTQLLRMREALKHFDDESEPGWKIARDALTLPLANSVEIIKAKEEVIEAARNAIATDIDRMATPNRVIYGLSSKKEIAQKLFKALAKLKTLEGKE